MNTLTTIVNDIAEGTVELLAATSITGNIGIDAIIGVLIGAGLYAICFWRL